MPFPSLSHAAALLALVAASASAAAQVAFPRGLGAPRPMIPASPPQRHVLDVQSIATANAGYTNQLGANGCLGVARTPDGHLFVTCRRDVPTSPHQIFEFDQDGAWVGSYAQPPQTAASEWGLRDLAWDGDSSRASRLFGGMENAASGNRIFAFDWQTRQFDSARDVVLTSTRVATSRALAFVPPNPRFPTAVGGVLVVADYFSRVEFVDALLGVPVALTVPSVQPGTFGAAYDPVRETVWFGGQTGSRRGESTQVVFSEMDLTGRATGRVFLGDLTVPFLDENLRSIPGGLCGGVEFFANGSGAPTIVYLAQATSDTVVFLNGRFEYGSGCGGAKISFRGEPYAGSSNFAITLSDAPLDATIAFLWIGLPLPPPGLPLPPMLANCALLLDPTVMLSDLFPAIPIEGGRASVPMPLAIGFTGLEAAFQFVVPTSTMLPVDLTAGGMIYVNRP